MEEPLAELAGYFRGDQAGDQQRGDRLSGRIVHAEKPAGAVQRHWLAEPITGDCPRCGWHRYFRRDLTTIGADWSAAVCGNCSVDLHPDLTVTAGCFSACSPADGQPVAVIRRRTGSDHDDPGIRHVPDRGQILTWRLSWIRTPMLVDDRRGNCDWDIARISRRDAGQIAAALAARDWPDDAARLPWVASACPQA
jgi:hypothetical protein